MLSSYLAPEVRNLQISIGKSTEPQSLPKSTKDDEEQCIAKLPNPTKQATKEKENETKKIANSSIDKENDDQPNQAKTETGTESDACPKAFVLFVGNDTALYSWPLLIKKMPYLHWECAEEVRKHKKILEENKAENQERSRSVGKDIEERKLAVTGKPMDDTEKLLWMFLGEDHPLHIRRTLDQYYYPNSSSIEDRDKDQTTLRYFEDQCLDSEEFDRVLTMVDQLWMWVLPRCGSSPPTILTAFPQRSNRKNSKRPTALVNNIQSKCRDLSRWSSYDVAKVIVAECSRIYFHSTSNRKKPVEFLDVYRTSIGRIVCVSCLVAIYYSLTSFTTDGSRCYTVSIFPRNDRQAKQDTWVGEASR
jgi:hypothetical protein